MNISDGQLHKYFQYMKTFHRVYLQFYQNFMQSSILFVLGLDLYRLFVIVISHELWGIINECTLDRTASLLPGLLFIVELERYDQIYHFVDVQNHMIRPRNS